MAGEVWLNNYFPFFCLPKGQISAFLILLYLFTDTLYSTGVSLLPRMDIWRRFTLCLWKNRHTKQKIGRRAEALSNYFCNLELFRIGSGPYINQKRDESASFTGLLFLVISNKKRKVNLYQKHEETKILVLSMCKRAFDLYSKYF